MIINFKNYSIKDFIEKTEEYIKNGLLLYDDYYNYRIYRYSFRAEFDNFWDEITTTCRSIIIDRNKKKVIARSFNKFFNINEKPFTNIDVLLQSDSPKLFTEKIDGWLGILFFDEYRNKWSIANRCSFYNNTISWLNDNLDQYININNLSKDDNLTHLFEIVSPETKIIVDYKNIRKIIYLGSVDKETGHKVFSESILNNISESLGVERIKTFKFPEIKTLEDFINNILTRNDKDIEGYVIRYENGLWVKAKYKWYIDLARILKYLTPLSFWKSFNPKTLSFDENLIKTVELIDDEKIKSKILNEFKTIESILLNKINLAKEIIKEKNKFNTRKDFVLYIKENEFIKQDNSIFSIVMNLYDNKEKEAFICTHKSIRPKSNEIDSKYIMDDVILI